MWYVLSQATALTNCLCVWFLFHMTHSLIESSSVSWHNTVTKKPARWFNLSSPTSDNIFLNSQAPTKCLRHASSFSGWARKELYHTLLAYASSCAKCHQVFGARCACDRGLAMVMPFFRSRACLLEVGPEVVVVVAVRSSLMNLMLYLRRLLSDSSSRLHGS